MADTTTQAVINVGDQGIDLDDGLAVYKVVGTSTENQYGTLTEYEIQQRGNVIVQDGKVWRDMSEPEVIGKVKEGKIAGIYHYGGKNQRWTSDVWDGADETKPRFHALDPLDPQLFYKADAATGLPVPFQAPTDADGNVYLSTDSPGVLDGPLLQSKPGTYYYDGSASFDRVLGPDDPDQAILLLSRGQKPEVVPVEEGQNVSYTYESNQFVDNQVNTSSNEDVQEEEDEEIIENENKVVQCTIL